MSRSENALPRRTVERSRPEGVGDLSRHCPDRATLERVLEALHDLGRV
ncbi:hypothetical protein NI17_000420 [Thermobifida halotolerans]|uniref:Uncharacterized protein n=1 Tax=Thermobifida halotolerans TaxID=483545 RepID=A0AA97LXQ6_9ACTN|nr:hypothetical protein [Thermobifida halotolerans]UOE19771.1 hypothetical protein NI17_000420 [Thermobifida halotolerans]